MDSSKKAKLIIVIMAAGFILLVTIVAIIAILNNKEDTNKQDTVHISNLDKCSQNMQTSIKESMRTNMYLQVKLANDYNKKESLPSYEAVIRDGTCGEETLTSNTITGAPTESKQTRAILDIPDARQSWEITYHWIEDGKPIETDLGTIITPSCIDAADIIYEDFNCEKIMSLQKYGTDQVDPILEYMPYFGGGFNLTYNPDTKGVAVELQLRSSQMENEILAENLKRQVEYWFTLRGLDITNYTVTYSKVNIDNKDYHGGGDEDLVE